MDPDTGEPKDSLIPQARQMIENLGSRNTKVSEIVAEEDRAVFTAIQEGLDRANEAATSRAQRVGTTFRRPCLSPSGKRPTIT